MRDAAIDAAARLGVLAELRVPQTASALASACDLELGWLTWLLAGLAGEGLLARDGESYLAVRDTVEPAEGGALLAEVLRRRRPLAWTEIAGNPAAAALTVPLDAASVFSSVIAELACALATGGLFVDVGCGAGGHAEAVLEAAPRARALLVDRRSVLATAATRLARFGSRVALREQDITVFAGEPCSAVLLSQVLHLLPEEQGAELVRRMGRLLVPHGVVTIAEVDVEDPREASAEAAWFGLSLLVYGLPAPMPRSRLAGWCAGAGLQDVTVRRFAGRPGTVLVTARAAPSQMFAD